MYDRSILLRLLALLHLMLVCICGFEEVSNKLQQRFIEEQSIPRRRYTLFWDSHREKVTQYVNENKEKIRLNPSETLLLKLPNDVINNFRRLTRIGRSRSGLHQKVLEISNFNFFDILNGVNSGQR